MNCKRALRHIPLLAGSDLAPSKRVQVLQHLQECRGCRLEYQAHLLSLKSTKEWLAADTVDWEEVEWKKTIQRALGAVEKKRLSLVPWPFKKGWAYALIAATTILLMLFVLHPSLMKKRKEMITSTLSGKARQDIISIKIVSKETGLKINWFFHKDLKLEVMK